MRVAVLGGEARDLINFRGHLISEMVKQGHTVFAIAPGGTPEIQEGLAALGAEYVSVKLDRTGTNPIKDLTSLVHLWRLFRRLQLDLLLAYEVKSVIYGTRAAALAGVSRRYAMITGRGTTLQGQLRGLRQRLVQMAVKRLFRGSLSKAQGVIFQNSDDLSFFLEEGMLSEKVSSTVVSGSGVDLDHFGFAPVPGGDITFLFVGRLLWDKGIQEFVDAANLLARASWRIKCQILGPMDSNPRGVRPNHLESWTREGRVEYLGAAGDVRPYLASAHVMVLPSRGGEGVPRSVLEALSMGRAVVTTDSPGCRETVAEGKNGFLVPVQDAPALAEAMGKLACDPELVSRFGKEGRRIAESRFDVRLVTADILDFMGVQAVPN